MPEGRELKMENDVEAQLLHNEKIKSEPNVKQDRKHKIGKEEIAVVEDIKDIKGVNEVKVVNAVKDVKGVKVVKTVKGVNGVDSKQTSESALCEICSKTFANRYVLKSHTKLHGEKTDICDVCSKSFSNKHILKAHMLTHTAEKVKCQMCLESVFGLKKHMKNKHGETRLVTCSNCGVEVKRISTHERFCRMTEEERAAYKETIKVECEQCCKVLANKFKLIRHIEAAHSKIRLLECEFCDHKDNRTDNLKTHIKNNHTYTKE